MVTADEDAVASRLAMLGTLNENGMDQRLARFRNRLRDLREDPAEAARIDALVAAAEREDQDPGTGSGNGNGLTVHVNGGVVHLSHHAARTETGWEGVWEQIAAMELELTRLRLDLEAVKKETPPQRTETPHEEPSPRPRRTWEAVLAPAFGSGVLVAILAAATVTTALHAAVVALTVIASVLAATTAATAFLSVWMPLASVRALNRRGHPDLALELLSRRAGTSRFPARTQNDDEAAAATTGIAAPPQTSPSLEWYRQRYLLAQHLSRPGACPNCGQVVSEDDALCRACGTSLSVVRLVRRGLQARATGRIN
jgi:hypothetical protein